MRLLAALCLTLFALAALPVAGAAQTQDALVTANPYLGTAVSPYDARVSPYSPNGANNRYTTSGGKIYAQDGTYLGRLNANQYDPESVANPYGQYGSKYSPTSINNRYSTYGSPYSPLSATNPYSTTPPVVRYPSSGYTAPRVTVPTYTAPTPYTLPCYVNCK
jgi:hypothetical protein